MRGSQVQCPLEQSGEVIDLDSFPVFGRSALARVKTLIDLEPFPGFGIAVPTGGQNAY